MEGSKEREFNNLRYLATNGTDRKFRANSRLSLFFDRRCYVKTLKLGDGG